MPPAVMPTSPGMHRVTWDLRYPDPPDAELRLHRHAARLPRVHLELARDPGKTPRTTLVGPMVVPGTYTATLTVDGTTLTRPITVVADPRVPVTPPRSTPSFASSSEWWPASPPPIRR